MRKLLLALPVIAAAVALPGCGASAPAAPIGPLALSPEQAEAIAREDSRVQDEEGGAFVANLAKAKAKALAKASKKK